MRCHPRSCIYSSCAFSTGDSPTTRASLPSGHTQSRSAARRANGGMYDHATVLLHHICRFSVAMILLRVLPRNPTTGSHKTLSTAAEACGSKSRKVFISASHASTSRDSSTKIENDWPQCRATLGPGMRRGVCSADSQPTVTADTFPPKTQKLVKKEDVSDC